MKIQILTFVEEINYGAILQSWSLKNHLENLGFEVEFVSIKLNNEASLRQFLSSFIGKTFSSTKIKINNKLRYLRLKKVFKAFLTEHGFKINQINNQHTIFPSADIYIVGSDQVWSPRILSPEKLKLFFLNKIGNSTKKIAFAASSGGMEFSPGERNDLLKNLEQFHLVSVREKSLKMHLNSLGFTEVDLIPDPTFLMNWPNVLDIKGTYCRSKIGVFALTNQNLKKAQKVSNIVSEKLKEKVENLASLTLNPFQWIKKISNFKYLITDSYHAVLFAIFTHTPFVFILWGREHKRDSRVIEILEYFELTHCAVEVNLSNSDVELPLDSIIDWGKIDSKKHILEKNAKAFIQKIS